MKRAQTMLVSILLAVSALGASTQGAFAYTADVWTNSNSFSYGCLGFTDTYPQQLYSLNQAQIAALGYAPVRGAIGSGFTTGNFLGNVLADWTVYVHSHGDNYWGSSGGIDSGFRQDPGSGSCVGNIVRSSAIQSATRGTRYNLVIMSTCNMGSGSSTMPTAFQIEKIKNNTQPEFYLGYVYLTYDSAQLRFENAFWSYVSGSPAGNRRTLLQAFTYASSIGGYEAPDSADPFQANWWGSPTYTGVPG
jgi:hypothetical protein